MSTSTHRALFATTAAASALLLSACGGGGNGNSAEASADEEVAEAVDADVTIVNFGYEDEEYTTTVGSEVVWVNEGAAPHTVTGDNFDSDIIRNGGVFRQTFDEPGTYEYWCTNHEGVMTGTIVVE